MMNKIYNDFWLRNGVDWNKIDKKKEVKVDYVKVDYEKWLVHRKLMSILSRRIK